ncbi:MAG: hypothetical protein AMJ81_13510 [Phycisphaerae bacterium SM23_33]|nr:MAG: hypothetical protein AMJ81_13510 [Phycisphaerae bacterium SM23_33]
MAAGAAGCDPPRLYTPTEGGYMGATITPKTTWIVRGNLSTPSAAADENLASIARSDYDYAGAHLTIDLGQPCMFQTVIIDHGREDRGHCRTVGVATSLDGRLWIGRHTGPGTRRVTILSLPQVVLARYVRIQAAQPGVQPWAVAELYLQ